MATVPPGKRADRVRRRRRRERAGLGDRARGVRRAGRHHLPVRRGDDVRGAGALPVRPPGLLPLLRSATHRPGLPLLGRHGALGRASGAPRVCKDSAPGRRTGWKRDPRGSNGGRRAHERARCRRRRNRVARERRLGGSVPDDLRGPGPLPVPEGMGRGAGPGPRTGSLRAGARPRAGQSARLGLRRGRQPGARRGPLRGAPQEAPDAAAQ